MLEALAGLFGRKSKKVAYKRAKCGCLVGSESTVVCPKYMELVMGVEHMRGLPVPLAIAESRLRSHELEAGMH